MNHLSAERQEAMKFILNGRSFDTATATQVAISRGVSYPALESRFDELADAEQIRFENVLFRTKKGNFFIHYHQSVKFSKGKPVVTDSAWEVDETEAVNWIQRESAAILDGEGLPLPEEG